MTEDVVDVGGQYEEVEVEVGGGYTDEVVVEVGGGGGYTEVAVEVGVVQGDEVEEDEGTVIELDVSHELEVSVEVEDGKYEVEVGGTQVGSVVVVHGVDVSPSLVEYAAFFHCHLDLVSL